MRCSRKAKMLLTRYGHASEDFALKGSMHPDDWDAIDANLLKARAQIENYIATLEAAIAVTRAMNTALTARSASATKDPKP